MREFNQSKPVYAFEYPESRLFLFCLRADSAPVPAAETVRSLAREANWSNFTRLTDFHGLSGAAYRFLRRHCADAVPAATMEHLKQGFYYNGVHNLELLNELVSLSELFEQHGIPALSLKGPVMASQLYQDLSLRYISDLDLLVQEENLPKCRELLVARGYQACQGLDGKAARKLLETDCEIHFTHPARKLWVEIHWRFFPRHTRDVFERFRVWETREAVRLGDRTVHTLPRESTFIYQCLHGGEKHQWASMRFVCDIARMIETWSDLAWDNVLRQAEQMGQSRTILFACYLAHNLLASPLPPVVRQALAANRTDWAAMAALVQGRLLGKNFSLPGFLEWRHYLQASAAARRAPQPAGLARALWLRYLRHLLRPEFNDRACLPPLPGVFSFVHYFTRMVRIFRTHKSQLLRRLR